MSELFEELKKDKNYSDILESLQNINGYYPKVRYLIREIQEGFDTNPLFNFFNSVNAYSTIYKEDNKSYHVLRPFLLALAHVPEISDHSRDMFLSLLNSEERDVKIAALNALRHFDDPTTVIHIIDLLKDTDQNIQKYAKDAILSIGVKLTNSQKKEVGRKLVDIPNGIRLIGDLQIKNEIPALMNLITNKCNLDAIIAISTMKHTPAISSIIECCAKLDRVRTHGLKALTKYEKSKEFDNLIPYILDGRSRIYAFSKARDNDYTKYIPALLCKTSDDKKIQILAILVDLIETTRYSDAIFNSLTEFGEIGYETIIGLLNNLSDYNRYKALQTLGKFNDEKTKDFLLSLYSDKSFMRDSSNQYYLVNALSKFKYPDVRECLLSSLRDAANQKIESLIIALSDPYFFNKEVLTTFLDIYIDILENGKAKQNKIVSKLKSCKDDALELLIEHFKNKDLKTETRKSILNILGSYYDERIVDFIRGNFKREDIVLRKIAVEILGYLDFQSTISALTDFLEDESDDIKFQASKLLCLKGESSSFNSLIDFYWKRELKDKLIILSIIQTLGSEKQIPFLESLLSEENASLTFVINEVVDKIKNKQEDKRLEEVPALGTKNYDIQNLRKNIKSDNEVLRLTAYEKLAIIGDDKNRIAMTEAHDSRKQQYFINRFVPALNTTEYSSFIEWFLEKDNKYEISKEILECLKPYCNFEVFSLLSFLFHKYPPLEHNILEIYGSHGEDALPYLLDLVYEKKQDVIKHRTSSSKPTALQQLHKIHNLISAYTILYFTPAVPNMDFTEENVKFLLEVLRENNRIVQGKVIDIFSGFETNDVINPLIDMLQTDDQILQQKLFSTLGKIGKKSAVNTMLEIIKKEENEHRKAELEKSIRNINDDRILDYFISRIFEKDDYIPLNAAKNIAKMKTVSAKKIGALLDNEDAYVRFLAAKILSLVDHQEAKEYLKIAASDKEPPVRFAATHKWEFYD